MPEDINSIAEEFLYYLKKNTDKQISITALKSKFRLTDKKLVSIISTIESWGYKLKLSANRIDIISSPDNLIDTEIKFDLKTEFVGQNIKSYQSVKSTNVIASSIAEKSPNGTIVIAEQQTEGKGRLGRRWYSPSKTGIYLSIILKPKFKPESAPAISIMTAFALAETLKKFSEAKVQIKWPNDILLNGNKTAGILTELSAERNKINYLIVGVGINVNQSSSDFPDDLIPTATSLRIVNRKKNDRVKLLRDFLCKFEKEFVKYCDSQHLSSIKKINEYSSLSGKNIQVMSGSKLISGIAHEIDRSGALIMNVDDKKIAVNSGEVTIIK